MTSRLVSTHLHNFHPRQPVTMSLYTPSQLRAVTPVERDLALTCPLNRQIGQMVSGTTQERHQKPKLIHFSIIQRSGNKLSGKL
jgi:hypothetical protein